MQKQNPVPNSSDQSQPNSQNPQSQSQQSQSQVPNSQQQKVGQQKVGQGNTTGQQPEPQSKAQNLSNVGGQQKGKSKLQKKASPPPPDLPSSNPFMENKINQKRNLLIYVIVGIVCLLILAGGVAAGYYLYSQGKIKSDETSQQSKINSSPATSVTTSATTAATTTTAADDSFEIKETLIGDWEDVAAYKNRLEITTSGAMDCTWNDSTTKCITDDGVYVLEKDSDTYTLKKNGEQAWKKKVPSGPCPGVTGFKVIGDEFAIDYLDITTPRDSIVTSNEKSLLDILDAKAYDKVFAPFPVSNKLVYVAEANNKNFLVYDDTEVGKKYDEIYYACCCEGMLQSVRGNGDYIDFFAKYDGKWYHVEAGVI